MNTITTRAASRGARYGSPSRGSARAQAAAGGGGRQLAAAEPTDPASPDDAAGDAALDVAARLDELDAAVDDHEARIAALEQQDGPEVGTTAAAARGAAPAGLDVRAVYARANARRTGSATTAPAMTSSVAPGSAVDTAVIFRDFNNRAARNN